MHPAPFRGQRGQHSSVRLRRHQQSTHQPPIAQAAPPQKYKYPHRCEQRRYHPTPTSPRTSSTLGSSTTSLPTWGPDRPHDASHDPLVGQINLSSYITPIYQPNCMYRCSIHKPAALLTPTPGSCQERLRHASAVRAGPVGARVEHVRPLIAALPPPTGPSDGVSRAVQRCATSRIRLEFLLQHGPVSRSGLARPRARPAR